MSFCTYVIVHKERWPTFTALQASLKAIGAPLKLEKDTNQPFSIASENSEIPVTFEDRPVLIEAMIDTVTRAELADRDTVFGDIASLIELNFTVAEGDRILTLVFRADVDPIRAGLYLAAAIILGFDGYGFEEQFESYGGPGFANRILEEASNVALWDD